jgi:hypothetical protein
MNCCEDQGRVDEARAADRPGGYLGAAGLKNRARLVQVRTTRWSFRDLSRRAIPLPSLCCLRRPLARFRSGGPPPRPAAASDAWAAAPGPGAAFSRRVAAAVAKLPVRSRRRGHRRRQGFAPRADRGPHFYGVVPSALRGGGRKGWGAGSMEAKCATGASPDPCESKARLDVNGITDHRAAPCSRKPPADRLAA